MHLGGAVGATIHYLGILHPAEDPGIMPSDAQLKFYMPLTGSLEEVMFNTTVNVIKNTSGGAGTPSNIKFQEYDGRRCAYFPKNNGIRITDNSHFNMNGDFTLAVWLRPLKITGREWNTYLRFGQKATYQSFNLGGFYQDKIYGGTDGRDLMKNLTGDPTWIHHALTYDSTEHTLAIYFNGKQYSLEANLIVNPNFGSTGFNFGITNRVCENIYAYGIRVYNEVLTAKNIAYLNHNHI